MKEFRTLLTDKQPVLLQYYHMLTVLKFLNYLKLYQWVTEFQILSRFTSITRIEVKFSMHYGGLRIPKRSIRLKLFEN